MTARIHLKTDLNADTCGVPMISKAEKLIENSRQAVSYMIEEITHICRRMKKRAPGSEGEREAGVYMAGILKSACGCRAVITESFPVHPASFYGYFYFSATFDCLCAAFFFLLPWLSILFGLVAFFIFIVHFVLYRQLLDPLFPEQESLNVMAVRPCSGEVKRRIFLNGHIDAAWEFPLNYHFGGIVFETPGVLAVVGVLYYIFLDLCVLFSAGGWIRTAGIIGLLFIPVFFLVAFTYNPRRVVDGANDNLTGCYLGIAVLREMERLGISLEHTEVGVILTGSEEAGLRGAKAWCQAHKNDYLDVPTDILCFDTIHDPQQLMVNRKDLNSTVLSDRVLGDLFLSAARRAGVPCKTGKVPLMGGSTDSAAFSQGGFRSVGITGLSHKLEDYYHTRKDTWNNLDTEGLENCYKAVVTMLGQMDQETAPEK